MFDKPLFWIILVWWLVSTFLGAKARKRRRAAMEMAAQEPEETAALEPEETAPVEPREMVESEPAVIPRYAPEVIPATPVAPPQPIPATPVAPPQPIPAKPVTPLQEIFHALGMEDRPALFGALRAAPEPEITLVEAEPPLIEPAKPPPRQRKPPPREEPTVSPQPKAKIRPHYPALPLASLERLTPWQQALVLKEILDSPLAVRSRTW